MEKLDMIQEESWESLLEIMNMLDASNIKIETHSTELEIEPRENCRTIRRVRKNEKTGKLEIVYITVCKE